jgi:[acyl-carrier-protein] S-malonyltransferase
MSKIAFIFPGQGAQKVGMGKDFYEQYEIAREVFDNASKVLDLDMKKLCFEPNDELNLTEYTQVALLTTCLAMEKVVESEGLTPDVVAGLSLGEYCALETAGAMNFVDAVQVVRKRGLLMEEAVPAGVGSMAAILGLDASQIESVLEDIEDVSIANYNCPGQIVITGLREAVDRASVWLKEAGARRILPLQVSGPFHSVMLEEAGQKLAKVLEDVSLSELKIPYVTNVNAQYVNDSKETKDLLAKQICSSVKWQQSVEKMIEDGVDTFIEIGPGKTLTGFLKKIAPQVTSYNIQTVEDFKKVRVDVR